MSAHVSLFHIIDPKSTSYAWVNMGLVGVLALLLLYSFFRETTFFVRPLFDSEASQYRSYFSEDFSGYDANSEVLDSSAEDLSRWQANGSITAWVDIADWRKVERVDLALTDASGTTVVLRGTPNLALDREENQIKSNDAFPEHQFNCPDQSLKEWEDFLLISGTNLVFWEYAELPVDMSNIVSWKVQDQSGANLPAEDIVVHDGLCADRNSLAGAWYTPNGLPQYGVWWTENGTLRMRNVEQEQYPSNGDHARILSKQLTPDNFLMRIRFTASLPAGSSEEVLSNTYLRFGWDFDNVYDPGHDQSLVYATLQYGYLGLQRVYPIERYFVQGYEPPQEEARARTDLTLQDSHTYELQVKVEGQHTEAEMYDIGRFYTRRVATVSYDFERARPVDELPFSIEKTGNVDMTIDDIQVLTR